MKNILYLIAFTLFVSCTQEPTIETQEEISSRAEGFTSQLQPNLYIRFANERLLIDKYVVDVELKCDSINTELFGMNVRFFYDAADFTTACKLINFQGGYGLYVWDQPKVYTGNTASNIIFKTSGASRFVNGSMQLMDKSKPKIVLDNWAKVFEIELTPNTPTTSLNNFCPELIWDKMSDPLMGSFLAGSDGVTATVLARVGTKYETTPTVERPEYFNWVSTGTMKFKYPYGAPKCNQ